jgi:hypothetical protein
LANENPVKSNAAPWWCDQQLFELVDMWERDDDVKVVIVRGKGDDFSAGHDFDGYLGHFKISDKPGVRRRRPSNREQLLVERDLQGGWIRYLFSLKPVIAEVRGRCFDMGNHPRGGDRQRPGLPRRPQPEIELQLPGRDPLPGGGFQGLQFRLIVRRPDVLDATRAAPRRPHDLHRGRARLRLRRPHIRHRPTLRATVSAQICIPRTRNPQVSALRFPRTRKCEPIQGDPPGLRRVP